MFHQVYVSDTGQKEGDTDSDLGRTEAEAADATDPMKEEAVEEAMETETSSVAEVDQCENDEFKSKMAMEEQGIIENLVPMADDKVKREKLTLKELKKPLKLKKAKILQYRKNRMSAFERYLLLKRNLKRPMVGKEQYVFVFVLDSEIHNPNSSSLSSPCNIVDVSSALSSFAPSERVELDNMNLPLEKIQSIASRVIDDLSNRNKSPVRPRSNDTGHKYFVVSNTTTVPDKKEDECLPRRTRASIFRTAKARSINTSLIESDDFFISNSFIEDFPTFVKEKKPRKVKKHKVQPDENLFKCEVCVKNFKSETLLGRHKESASCKKRTSIFLGTTNVPVPEDSKELSQGKEEELVEKNQKETDTAYNSGFSDFEDNNVAADSDYEEPLKKPKLRKRPINYSCKKCSESFSNKSLLNRHIRTVCRPRPEPSTDPFICEVCGKNFVNRQVFKRHVRDHKETEQNLKQYVCGECGKRFNRRASLYMHVKKVHRRKVLSYVCAHCGLRSVSKEHVLAHEQVHRLPEGAELPTPHQCKLCAKAFISNYLLMEHRRQKHRPKRCTPCATDFRSVADLLRHRQAVHGKPVNQRCPVCARQLANVLSLNVHLENTHNIKNPGKEKTIRCDVCGKKFVTFGSFVNHMWECHEHRVSSTEIQAISKKLTDDLMYFYSAKKMCPICHKELASPLSLNNHMESIHKLRTWSETKSIRCGVCGKSFAMLGSYINHKTETHKEEVQAAEVAAINDRLLRESPTTPASRCEATCPSCGKLFKNRTSLYMHEYNVHRPSKEVVCSVCRLTFDGRKSYLDHKYDVHTPVEQKVCRLCNKQFRSRGAHWAHKYVHTSPSHHCHQCGSVFKRKGDFTRHLKDKHNMLPPLPPTGPPPQVPNPPPHVPHPHLPHPTLRLTHPPPPVMPVVMPM